MSNHRRERIDELLRREVSRIVLYELKDPRIAFTTVTKAETSRDVKSAKVFVSVMGSEADQRRTLRALRDASGFIQGAIGKLLRTRNTPSLLFVLDEGVKKSIRVSQILNQFRPRLEGEPLPEQEPRRGLDEDEAEGQ